MKFSFRNNSDDNNKTFSVSGVQQQQQQQPPIEVSDVREVYPAESAAGVAASTGTNRTAPSHNIRNEDPRRMGILLFPETQDVKDFWVLYQRISNSGLKCHAGIFEQTADSTWVEQKVE
jgi:hypothetical protein